jgi:hypothetical protein
VNDQFHAPIALLPEKAPLPPYALDRRLAGPHNRSGIREKTNLVLIGLDLRPLGTPARSASPVAIVILNTINILNIIDYKIKYDEQNEFV